jgi:hypothetical protein
VRSKRKPVFLQETIGQIPIVNISKNLILLNMFYLMCGWTDLNSIGILSACAFSRRNSVAIPYGLFVSF